MCPQGPLPVNGMNGDIINRVKDGPFLDKSKSDKKAATGKADDAAKPKAAV